MYNSSWGFFDRISIRNINGSVFIMSKRTNAIGILSSGTGIGVRQDIGVSSSCSLKPTKQELCDYGIGYCVDCEGCKDDTQQ